MMVSGGLQKDAHVSGIAKEQKTDILEFGIAPTLNAPSKTFTVLGLDHESEDKETNANRSGRSRTTPHPG